MRATWVLSLIVVFFATACGDDNVTGPENKFSAEATFDYSVSATGHNALRVEGINGTVQITGGSGVTQVSISGKRRVEAGSQSGADAGLAVLEVEVDSSAAEVAVRTIQPNDARNYTVNYVISIPENWEVVVINANGNVMTTALKNDLEAHCANGTVTVGVENGDAIVTVANGAIEGTVSMATDGVINMTMGNGAIALRIPQDTSAQFAASVGNGTIETSNLTLTDVTHTLKSLTGTLGAGEGSIVLHTGNGAIAVVGI